MQSTLDGLFSLKENIFNINRLLREIENYTGNRGLLKNIRYIWEITCYFLNRKMFHNLNMMLYVGGHYWQASKKDTFGILLSVKSYGFNAGAKYIFSPYDNLYFFAGSKLGIEMISINASGSFNGQNFETSDSENDVYFLFNAGSFYKINAFLLGPEIEVLIPQKNIQNWNNLIILKFGLGFII